MAAKEAIFSENVVLLRASFLEPILKPLIHTYVHQSESVFISVHQWFKIFTVGCGEAALGLFAAIGLITVL